jgi:integrase
LLYTGLRIGELLALTWEDVDFQNRTIKVNKNLKQVKNRDGDILSNYKIIIQNSTKTNSSSRIVPLNNKSIEALNHIKEITGQYKYVLSTETGNNIFARAYDTMFRKIQKSCGFKEIYGVHALRHTFASLLFKKGVDVKTVSEILGHKDVSVTYNIYIHLIQEQKASAINLLDI